MVVAILNKENNEGEGDLVKHQNKVVQLDNSHVQQMTIDRNRRRQVHIRRCERIIGVFVVIFLLLGFQIYNSKKTLANVNNNISQANTQLAAQKSKGRQLNQEIRLLHDPDYLQQVIRSKYNYSKKGETIYNLNN